MDIPFPAFLRSRLVVFSNIYNPLPSQDWLPNWRPIKIHRKMPCHQMGVPFCLLCILLFQLCVSSFALLSPSVAYLVSSFCVFLDKNQLQKAFLKSHNPGAIKWLLRGVQLSDFDPTKYDLRNHLGLGGRSRCLILSNLTGSAETHFINKRFISS